MLQFAASKRSSASTAKAFVRRLSARAALATRALAACLRVRTVLAAACLLALASATPRARNVVTLDAIDALPAWLAGTFEGPLAYQRLPDGTTYVFDRGGHTVYRIDAARKTATPIVRIGFEEGRILLPSAFDAAPDGTFVVADAPKRKERVQLFDRDGVRLAGFELAGGAAPRIIIGSLVLNGIGSIAFTGKSILINRPETGGLITEYDVNGRAIRTIGALRATGHEADRELHLAFNSVIPLAVPGGGYFAVFRAGEPRFARYDAAGTKLFERAIQGPELDKVLAQQPTEWPRRVVADTEYPLVLPVIRAARVDPSGHLWISLMLPFTYEYDEEGEKLRTVQFHAAGIIAPSSLYFARSEHGGTRLLVTPGLFEFETASTAR